VRREVDHSGETAAVRITHLTQRFGDRRISREVATYEGRTVGQIARRLSIESDDAMIRAEATEQVRTDQARTACDQDEWFG
jgi:hypothetical protein